MSIKLYYSKGACSLAPHIVLQALNLPHELIRVDVMRPGGIPPELASYNPLEAVPVIVLPNGESLTEVAVILQYLADLKPEANLAPKNGTWERVRLQETLNFIATELHKGFGPLFGGAEVMTTEKAAHPQIKQWAKDELLTRFTIINNRLKAQGPWIMGSQFTVADAYLFTISTWSNYTGFDLSALTFLKDYMARAKEHPPVNAAMKAEHLIR